MKKTGLLNCILAAFAIYSRIPVPEAKWDDDSLRWQICCFPFVGVVIGVLWCAAGTALALGGAHPALAGALLTALPVLLTGGIHMDGFLDTSDAVHSWKSREERLHILDDPHIGAFALIYGILYMLIYFGFSVQMAASVREAFAAAGQAGGQGSLQTALSADGMRAFFPYFITAPCFVLTRVLSAVSVIRFPKAKKDGMLRTTADGADKGAAKVLNIWIAAAVLLFAAEAFFFRSPAVLVLPACAAGVFAYYHHMTMDRFGGVSGDPAGWFLQVCELVLLAAAAVTGCMF